MTTATTMDCPTPVGLLAELTHRCPLQCLYCSNPIELVRRHDELSTEQWLGVFRQAADLGVLQLHLSGGEPTLRRDLEELVGGAHQVGLYSNLITSAYGVTRLRLAALSKAGLRHVQISIQDADPGSADSIAGTPGAHRHKLEIAKTVPKVGLALTINVPVHRGNIGNMEAIIDLAIDVEAQRLEIAHVQYYGWALLNRDALLPSRQQVEQCSKVVAEARERLKGVLSIDFVAPDYFASRPKACMGGWGQRIIAVTPSGRVLPCHAAETIAGMTFNNVRERQLHDIWTNSSAFNAFRGVDWMKEPCRSCEFKRIDWGGCRCQAFSMTGAAQNTDPICSRSPARDGVDQIVEEQGRIPKEPIAGRPLLHRHYPQRNEIVERPVRQNELDRPPTDVDG